MSFGIIFLVVICVILLAWLVYILVWGTPPSINLAVERLALRRVIADPETLTMLGIAENTLLDFHSGRLTDASSRFMAQVRKLDRDGLALIRRYDREVLSKPDWITYQVMHWYFEQNLRGHKFEYHWAVNPVFMGPYPVNHIFGVQIDLVNFLVTYHKIKGKRSVRRYLQRLEMVRWKINGLVESLETRESQGVIPPRFVLEKSLAQIEAFISDPIDQNPLYMSVLEKMADSNRFKDADSKYWGAKIKELIGADVLPAYRKLNNVMLKLLEKATDEDGVWKLPTGREYYAFLLRNHTTTDLTPEEIHQLGFEEVERLTESIRTVLMALDLPSDEPGQQLKGLMEDHQFHYTGDNCRQAILEDYQAILDEVNERMPEIFSQGSLEKIVVKRLPEFKESDSPIALAEPPSLDGTRPGTMWVNLRDPDNVYRWGMRTLAYHEGIPGHVYQLAQAQKIRRLPTFRRTHFFNAHVEGWALYAERLGWEIDLEDALSNLGRLQALLWRAVRLVVDTGIHAMQWNREQAIEYMVEKTGLPERDVITEVERYIVMPGQACAYYLGYWQMIALRQKAESTLGTAFDVREFHDVVLNNGSLPLPLLEIVVNEYIDQAAKLNPVNLE